LSRRAVTVKAFISRLERFDRVGSTNDVVRDWLEAGTPEVCLAVADEQTSGRGRSGRSWVAPPGAALLLSLGFRPAWTEPERAWRVVSTVSMAMAEAAEEIAGLAAGAVRLKWPNDHVVEADGDGPRKLAGVLGETQGMGTQDPRLVVGIGVNADWRVEAFPPELAGSMTSLREAGGGRPIDLVRLRQAFLDRLIVGIEALRAGRFDGRAWEARQLTTGRMVRLDLGERQETVRAVGVDADTGALLVADPGAQNGVRQVLVGEIGHVRIADHASAGV
jgi:BirA family biotin operon repressor/biotin-[acetyl-CoA-carboxylase] ligase